MRFTGLVAATAALVGLVEAQNTTQVISGDGPPAPSLTRTAAVGTWTPKPPSNGLPAPSLDGEGRTIYINSASDFCLLMPPDPTKQNLVDAEAIAVSYCINPTNGTRPMPDGFIKTAHFRQTPSYVQITGTYDPAVMNFGQNDCGGEYDSEGAEGVGNPVGVTIKNGSYFSQFLGACDIPGKSVFCLRMCPSWEYCKNIYDLMGCLWNQPGDYDEPDAFTNCDANADAPPGVYGTSTFTQGAPTTPTPVTAPASSNCRTVASPTASGVTFSWNQEAAAASPSSSANGGSGSNGGSSSASGNGSSGGTSSASGNGSSGGTKNGAASMSGVMSMYAIGATAIVGLFVGGALLV